MGSLLRNKIYKISAEGKELIRRQLVYSSINGFILILLFRAKVMLFYELCKFHPNLSPTDLTDIH